jgi:glyoxylate reductase
MTGGKEPSGPPALTRPDRFDKSMVMKQKVYVGAKLPGRPEEALKDEHEVTVSNGETASQQEIEEAAPDAQALITLLSHRVDDDLLARCPSLRIVSNYAVGYNNIDVKSATSRGVAVTNTPDVLTETTADLAWALMMSAARRIVEADRFVRKGEFTGWKPSLFLGRDIHEKTLGVIGFGRIGRAVARRAMGFRMRVLYYDPKVTDISLEGGPWVERVELDTLLEKSDFVSIHCPLTPDTRHLIGKDEIAKMKHSAILINSARGPVVDEEALVDALSNGRLAGAGLDVYEDEPETAAGLTELENVVLAPHIGSATQETRRKMARMAVEAVQDILSGKPPRHLVNPEALR